MSRLQQIVHAARRHPARRVAGSRIRLTLLVILTLFGLAVKPAYLPAALQDSPPESNSNRTDIEGELAAQQAQLLDRYTQLEEKMYKLYEHERNKNPERSELLKKAFDQSKSRLTAHRLKLIGESLNESDLQAAQDAQAEVLRDLAELLTLLQSENRGNRLRDQITRLQDYLKEVDRLKRIQESLRAQAESGAEFDRLGQSQDKSIAQAQQLSNDIRINEEGMEATADESDSPPKTAPTDSANPEQSSTPANDGKNPVRQRVDQAVERMKSAQQALEQAQRDQSVEEMRAAEQELAAAQRELEVVLRQLREEEAMRALVTLENRFRQMLEQQIKVLDGTQSLDQLLPDQRGDDFMVELNKLAVSQAGIAKTAASALMIVSEDGTSPAFMQTVALMRDDMNYASGRLAEGDAGADTQSVQRHIVDTLSDMVEALAQSQRDFKSDKKQPSGRSEQEGERALVDQIAELKMLRGFQARINQQHDQIISAASDAERAAGVIAAHAQQQSLRRLSLRQAELHQITVEILSAVQQ